MILQFDDAQNIITLLDICERDYKFRKLVETELALLGIKRNLTKKTRNLIAKGVWASIGMSLNYEIEENHTLENNIVDETHNTEEQVMQKLTSEKLFASVHKLSYVRHGIISHRYGLHGNTPASYKDIGTRFNLAPQDVASIEKDALRELRDYMSDKPIVRDYNAVIALCLAIYWGTD